MMCIGLSAHCHMTELNQRNWHWFMLPPAATHTSKVCASCHAMHQQSVHKLYIFSEVPIRFWLVGCVGFNGHLRQYFSLS